MQNANIKIIQQQVQSIRLSSLPQAELNPSSRVSMTVSEPTDLNLY